ncbi:hypothetical protein HA42_04480 [Pantoea deleyi]|uniref:Uncharacterized protein n=1 Tax=Pantoea deleyi TaxID=470932 RepID=A0A506QMD7_9GAMM|nr:hypothetical protein [Pantoea deleyi]ORM84453.1 hypothetical protein HA42_04480 [Pantoea deleyi]TPV47413.1 hypothetical protein FJW01_04170 [Pantoea deleyi]
MSDHCFFTRGKETVVLRSSERKRAAELAEQGYVREPEEIDATDEKQALARLNDIRKEQAIDQHNFLSGAFAMPLIGVLTALAACLFWRKKR